MKRFHKRAITSLLLALLSLLFACTPTTKVPETTDAGNPNAPNNSFLPSQVYTVVRGYLYSSSEEISDAAELIVTAFKDVYGISCQVRDDRNASADGYEILLGDTNRAQSLTAYQALDVNDYTYLVESEKVIVICGGSPAATYQAARKFCTEVMDYEFRAAEQKPTIPLGTAYTYHDTYDYTAATLNGVALSDYTIAYDGYNAKASAVELAEALAQYTGKKLSVSAVSALTGNETALIALGTDDQSVPSNQYLLSIENHTILLKANSKAGYGVAVDKLLCKLVKHGNGTSMELSLPTGEYFHYEIEASLPTLTLDTEETTALCDGVTYTEQLYYDEKKLPYRTYILTVDPTKVGFYMGTTDDSYKASFEENEDKDNVKEHMQAAVENGVDVIAGINADFFAMQGDYHPIGLAIKEGHRLSDANGNPFFGVTTDGKAVIANANELNTVGKLQTAVGGNLLLLRNRELANFNTDEVAPRTVLGIREDGTVVIMVIDGRQPALSNGAYIAQCGLLLRQLGCESGIDLDGGGSSTLVTRDESTYTVRNAPSDGSLRDVYNSLLIVKK